ALSGTGWSCTLASPLGCTRSDALAAGTSYPPLTLTVTVAATAPPSVTNTVTVAGGGETNTANDTAADVTSIVSPTTGLVAAYAFNEGTGSTVTDLSGNGNTGTVANTTWSSGKYGSALAFNGTTARVTIPDAASLHLTTAMTLEAWVNPAVVTSAWRDVIYKGNDNYFLEATSDRSSTPGGGGIFGGTDVALSGAAAVPANTWTHLAVTYDGAQLQLYVNGAPVASVAQTGMIATSTNPLTVGNDSVFGQAFQGLIDDVRVYNIALSAAQIQADMTTPLGTPPVPDLTVTKTHSGTFSPGQTGATYTI